jgi:hypothetical protein
VSNYYIEDSPGHLKSVDLDEWVKARDNEKLVRVGRDVVDGFVVSTVLLGLDYRYGAGPPLIYETMVFDQRQGSENPWLELYGERYTFRSEAEAGHQRAVEWTRNRIAHLRAENLELS